MRLTFPAVFIIALLNGCSTPERPVRPSISEEQFIEFSAQSAVLTREARLAGQDSTTIRARLDSLRREQHVTDAQLDSAVTFYRSDLQLWESVTARTVKRLGELQRTGN